MKTKLYPLTSLCLFFASCGDESEYEYPMGNMTCPMEFRLVYSPEYGKKIPDDSQDCGFVFTAKHNHLEKCPSCGTSMNYIRAYYKETHRQMRERERKGDHRITSDDVEDMNEVLDGVDR